MCSTATTSAIRLRSICGEGLGFPGINEVDAAVFEIPGIAGSQDRILRAHNGGDHCVKLRDWPTDGTPGAHNWRVNPGGFLIKRENAALKFMKEQVLDVVGQAAFAFTF